MLAILIFLPITFTVIFGGLFYKNLVTGVPIIAVNLDDGLKSQKVLRDLYDTPEVEVIAVEGDAANVTARMLEIGASGAVVIPKDFSQKISRGENVSVELIKRNDDAKHANFLQSNKRLLRFFLNGADNSFGSNRDSIFVSAGIFERKAAASRNF